MAEIPEIVNKNALVLALVLGVAYLAAGVLQIGVSLGFLPYVVGMTDFLGGLLLVVVASVFLTGVKPIRSGKREGVSFVVVGILIAGLICVVQLVIIGTGTLGWILGFEDWSDWTVQQHLTPSIWLFVITLAVLGISSAFSQLHENGHRISGGQGH